MGYSLNRGRYEDVGFVLNIIIEGILQPFGAPCSRAPLMIYIVIQRQYHPTLDNSYVICG